MRRYITAGLIALVMTGGCSSETENTASTMGAKIDWAAVQNKRIVFGHQSVGSNLIQGLQTLATADGATLSITEQRDHAPTPGLTHFKIGRNEDPLSKIADFQSVIESGLGNGADIAMMKLCYIDFSPDSDPKTIADEYIKTLETLSKKYPKTRFIAVTAPLTTLQSGPKAWLKKLLGKKPGGFQENLLRHEFNRIIRSHFKQDESLFDLAKLEARGKIIEVDGQHIEALDPEFSDDGGHLNDLGQKVAASAWLALVTKPTP